MILYNREGVGLGQIRLALLPRLQVRKDFLVHWVIGFALGERRLRKGSMPDKGEKSVPPEWIAGA